MGRKPITRRLLLDAAGLASVASLPGSVLFSGFAWAAPQTVGSEAFRALIALCEHAVSLSDYYRQLSPYVRNRQPPPPLEASTEFGSSLLTTAQRSLAQARALPPLVFAAPLPPFAPVSGRRDAVRSEINGRMRAVQNAAIEYAQASRTLGVVRRTTGDFRRVARNLGRISNAILAARDEVGGLLFDQLLGPLSYAAVEVMHGSSVNTTLTQVASTLDEKGRAAKTALEDRRGLLLETIGFMEGVLAAEAEALAGDAERLKAEEEALADRKAANDALGEEIEQARAGLNLAAETLQEARERHLRLGGEAEQAAGLVSRTEAKIAELRPIVSDGYSGYAGCPNRKPWNQCTHGREKADFQTRLDEARDRLTFLRQNLPGRIADRDRLRRETAELRAQIEADAAAMAREQARVGDQEQRHQAENQAISEEAFELLQEMMRSRATEHQAANAAQAGYLSDERSRLNAPLE